MSYRVGIDFGTTFTAAAVQRAGEPVELVTLGENGVAAASVVFVAPDGSYVMGDAAIRRAVTDPDRVVREVKRRIGDPTPLLVHGEPIGAHTLAARFVGWVVDRVTEREGRPPEAIAVTYPASWGDHKRTLFADALGFQGLAEAVLVTEPAAAAVAYAAARHVEPGSAIGVYDLGGGTFDAAVVRQLDDGGFALSGRPDGIDPLGGIDFDDAVFDQVRATLGEAWTALDLDDPVVRAAAATLRRECTEAKKALSSDTEVTIPVLLPGVSTQVRMVRAEFEALIGPAVDTTVEALRRTVASAGMTPSDLSAVLLVGGSSRIPLVAQRVSASLDLPVTVDSDPKAVVAVGAVLSLDPAVAVVDEADEVPPVVARPPRGRRLVSASVALAVCLGALIMMAGTVGSDIGDTGGAAAQGDVAAPTAGPGEPEAGEVVDPWTGEPYTETTPPGPTRPKAEPTDKSPETLAPAPTTSQNRDDLIAGTPPVSVTNPPGGSSGGTTGPASETVTTTEETTTDETTATEDTTTEQTTTEQTTTDETTTDETTTPSTEVPPASEEPPVTEDPTGDPTSVEGTP